MLKTYQFTLSVKDDKNDACKTANITISGRQNLAKWALTCYDGSTHERLLSESSHSYMSAYYLSVFVLVATVLSTFRTDQPRFEFSTNSPWAISPYTILHTNEMLTCTNDVNLHTGNELAVVLTARGRFGVNLR